MTEKNNFPQEAPALIWKINWETNAKFLSHREILRELMSEFSKAYDNLNFFSDIQLENIKPKFVPA